MIIDSATSRMLQVLPADLKAHRWEIVRGESGVVRRIGGPLYKAVYMRLFEDGVDAEELAHYDTSSGQNVVRISTDHARSQSWEDALRDAIDGMRGADARRSNA